MKRSFYVGLFALLVLAFFSVGVLAEQVTIRYMMWDPMYQKLEEELIREFEKENPDIKVEISSLDTSNYWPRISAMAAAGELPDVFSMSTGYHDAWAKDGLMLNIQDLVDRDLNPDDYFVNAYSENRYPDKETGDMYAVPYAWVTTVLFYNKDMFDVAGLSYPTDEWTWDDFLNAAQKLTIQRDPRRAPEQYGFWWYGRYTHVESWVYANGGNVLNDSKTRVAFDDNAREAIQFLADLTNKYKVSPAHRDVVGIRQQDLFTLQQTAMWVDGSFMVANAQDEIGDSFRWGIAKVPLGPSVVPGEERAYYWPDSVAISANTKHKEAAWKWVKFLIGKNRPLESFMSGKVPIYKDNAYSAEWLQEHRQPGNMQIILELGEKLGQTTFTMGWSEWRGYAATGGAGMNGELDRVTNGEITAEQAIENITRYGNSILERYYPEP